MPWVHIQTSRTANHRQTGICTEKGIAQISAYTKEPTGCEIIIHILPALTTNQKEFSNPWIGMRQNTSSLVLRYSFPLQALVIRQSQNIYLSTVGKVTIKIGKAFFPALCMKLKLLYHFHKLPHLHPARKEGPTSPQLYTLPFSRTFYPVFIVISMFSAYNILMIKNETCPH